ncbi:hypothetical protein [Halomonas elongata]|uniref:hypothetical protein n=1 Tax=Halomonas elongata TaxID=2746 RepID=UPI0023AEA9F5|nr:hypothetical protein [Halomonas elongata]
MQGNHKARQAAMLCQDATFRLYLDRRRRHKFGLTESQLPDGTHNERDARDWICAACCIESRAELEHNLEAWQTFRAIRNRFNHWRVHR